jgi:ubiquinone biosynthesis protein UbiJ
MGRAMRQGKAPEAPDARDDEMAALRDEIAALAARLDALSPMTDDEDDDE